MVLFDIHGVKLTKTAKINSQLLSMEAKVGLVPFVV